MCAYWHPGSGSSIAFSLFQIKVCLYQSVLQSLEKEWPSDSVTGTEDKCVFKTSGSYYVSHNRKCKLWEFNLRNSDKESPAMDRKLTWQLQLTDSVSQWISAEYFKCVVWWCYLYLLLFVLLLKPSLKERGVY